MPIMRLKEIRGMSSEERTKKISELKTELSRLKTMISAGGAVENAARIRELRKTIARILTIEGEQKRQQPETPAAEAKTEEKAPKPKEKKKK
jgi:large subunit ribosomal protein L29